MEGVLIPISSTHFSAFRLSFFLSIRKLFPRSCIFARVMFSFTPIIRASPSAFLSSGTSPILLSLATDGLFIFTSLPFIRICPFLILFAPNKAFTREVLPAPKRPKMPSISPFLNLKLISSKPSALRFLTSIT